jgi:CheY-like chemotaxis protein
MCILLVDDEPMTLLCAVESFRDAGHNVIGATDGPDAVRLIEAWPGHFTALVTDYNMPHGMTGADLVMRMRESFPTIPMVIATAMSDAVPYTFRNQHQVHLLPKPYKAETLVAMVAGLLRH